MKRRSLISSEAFPGSMPHGETLSRKNLIGIETISNFYSQRTDMDVNHSRSEAAQPLFAFPVP